MVLCRSDLSILRRGEPVMRTEVAESASHMAQATRSHDHVGKPFVALHQLLTPIVSDQHTVFPPIMPLVCLTLANSGGPREQVVLSHPLSYHRQHIFVLFRSCKHVLYRFCMCVHLYVQTSMQHSRCMCIACTWE